MQTERGGAWPQTTGWAPPLAKPRALRQLVRRRQALIWSVWGVKWPVSWSGRGSWHLGEEEVEQVGLGCARSGRGHLQVPLEPRVGERRELPLEDNVLHRSPLAHQPSTVDLGRPLTIQRS